MVEIITEEKICKNDIEQKLYFCRIVRLISLFKEIEIRYI